MPAQDPDLIASLVGTIGTWIGLGSKPDRVLAPVNEGEVRRWLTV